MKNLSEFTCQEWLRLKPIVDFYKQKRNDLFLSFYLQKDSPNLKEFLTNNRSAQDQNIIAIVAFEQAWALNFLLSMAKKNIKNANVMVFDNSRDDKKRNEIADVCIKHNIPYLALPIYKTRHVNRSHGMAMSWIYHRVIHKIQPDVFGFIDHDLIPISPVDFNQILQNNYLYGLLNKGDFDYWSLWAGFCFYKFKYTQRKTLNFLYDFSRYLDTGGRNWNYIYSNLPFEDTKFASNEFVTVELSDDLIKNKVQIVDGNWLHMSGISYNNNMDAKLSFYQVLQDKLTTHSNFEDFITR